MNSTVRNNNLFIPQAMRHSFSNFISTVKRMMFILKQRAMQQNQKLIASSKNFTPLLKMSSKRITRIASLRKSQSEKPPWSHVRFFFNFISLLSRKSFFLKYEIRLTFLYTEGSILASTDAQALHLDSHRLFHNIGGNLVWSKITFC